MSSEEKRIEGFLKSLAEAQLKVEPETMPKVERIKAVEVLNQPDNMKKNGHYENTKPSGSSEGKMEKIGPKDSVTEPPHYKNLAIDTLELMSVNFSDEAYMGFLEGNVLKYVMRYKMKNGAQDLRKAQYYLELLINRQEMREENQNK